MKYLFLESKERYRSLGIKVDDARFVFNLWITFFPFFIFRREVVLVSTLSHNVYLNFLVKLANRLGITTVLLVDGIFEFNNSFSNPFLRYFSGRLYRPNFHDYILIQSDAVGCGMVALGGGSVIPVVNKRVWEGDVMRNLDKNSNNVLITTANTPCFNDFEYDALLSTIREISEWLRVHNIRFDYRIFDPRLICELGLSDSENVTSGDFSSIIDKYSHVVSTPSSLGLSVMSRGIALMQMVYRDTPLPFQSGWLFSQSFQVDQVMTSFLEADQERMNYQFCVLKSFSAAPINETLASVKPIDKPKNGSVIFSYFSLVASEIEVFSKLKIFFKNYLKHRG